MNVIQEYLNLSRKIVDRVAAQEQTIKETATLFTKSILAGRMVHVFGSGHSRIMVEEMWPRYGSFPGFNPIVELSLTFHNLVVGANGQRQAMFLRKCFRFSRSYSTKLRYFRLLILHLIISSSGTNIVPIEMAEFFRTDKK
jgi:uncharacterized phosphosugar-binding protein